MAQAAASIASEIGPKFEYVQEIGRGSFGVVVLARDATVPSRPLVAIKLLPRGRFIKEYRVYVAREILHHGSLVHPFVIAVYSVFLTQNFVAVVMEYAAGGDMFSYLKNQGGCLNEQAARFFFQQLILGLQYVHGRGVANRDLKLENLLLSASPSKEPGAPPAALKISDFGYSKHEYNSSARTGVGTPIYMSPEIILGGNRYDPKKADIWSAGIVLYTLLIGRYPFNSQASDYAQRVVQGKYAPLDPSLGLSPQVHDLVARMLIADPAQRITIDDIVNHPWFLETLPMEARGLNERYWAVAPDPSKPPLSETLARVEELVARAAEQGHENEPPLVCIFPAAATLA